MSDKGFVIVAVALDTGGVEAVRPWIRPTDMAAQYPALFTDLMGWTTERWRKAGPPQFPCLIDETHEVARLYGMLNVPTAVWIDEAGRVVRPPEAAGVSDAFRTIDMATFQLPPDDQRRGQEVRSTYIEAVRDWVLKGSVSRHVLSPSEVRRRVERLEPASAASDVEFRLAVHLYQHGHVDAARPHFAVAADLAPASWAHVRQAMQLSSPEAFGELAAAPEFWEAVAKLGEHHYYPPIELEGIS